MFGSSEVWGIALGSTDLRAVKMSRVGEQASVLEAEVIPYAGGEDGTDRDLQARQALQALVAKHKIRREKVAISVPGNAVFSKFITLPPVEKKRVPEIVKYESRQQIPFPIEEVVWDYQLVKSDLVAGEDIEVALFAIRREIIQAHLANCLSAGLRPQVIQAAPLSFCNYLQHDQPSEAPVAVLDVGQESAELLIIDGERYWPRSLGVGSRDLTTALQQKFQISLEKAEELRTQAVKSKQADRLFGVMKPVLQNLSGQVQRTLGFYKSQHPEVRFSKVILVGEFFDLPGIEGFFKETLRYEFARMGAPRQLALDEGLSPQEFAASAPGLGVPLGLGLQALGLGRIRTNLVPPESIQRQQQAAKRPWVGAAVVLVGVAVECAAIRADRDREFLDGAKTSAETQISAMERKMKDLEGAQQGPPRLEQDLARFPGLLLDRDTGLPRQVFSDILRRVVEIVPKDMIWADSVRIEAVPFASVPYLRDAPKESWLSRYKDEPGKRQTLKVRFEGRKVATSNVVRQELELVQKDIVSRLEGIQSEKGKIPFCGRFGQDFVTAYKVIPGKDGGEDYYTFTVECIVNPDFYAAPAPGAP